MSDQLTRQTLSETETEITDLAAHFDRLRSAVREVIIGHDRLLDALVMAFLCRGHILRYYYTPDDREIDDALRFRHKRSTRETGSNTSIKCLRRQLWKAIDKQHDNP